GPGAGRVRVVPGLLVLVPGPHVATPDLGRVAAAGDPHAADAHLVVVGRRAHPHGGGQVRGEAHEPAVAAVLGGAGLAGGVVPGDAGPGARAALHVLLEHACRQPCAVGGRRAGRLWLVFDDHPSV